MSGRSTSGVLEDSPLADGLNLLNISGSPASDDMKLAVKARMGDRVRIYRPRVD